MARQVMLLVGTKKAGFVYVGREAREMEDFGADTAGVDVLPHVGRRAGSTPRL